MKRKRSSNTHWIGVLFTAGAACIGTQSGTSALTGITYAFCTKAISCCGGLSQSACETEFDGAFTNAGFDTSSDYTTDAVNKCTSELQALACPSSCSFTLPPDCPAHGQTITLSSDGGASDSDTGGDAAAGEEAGE